VLRTHSPVHFVGILGWPLERTLSPAIHNAAFRNLGLDWIYLRWPVRPDELKAALAGLEALGGRGANVTMPHKQQVHDFVDELSGDAKRAGAVNTIQVVGKVLVGHNTDTDGFKELLQTDAAVDPRGQNALVLGTGGAARAVVCGLDDLGARGITVAARREERGAELAELAASAKATVVPWNRAWNDLPENEIVVNATPPGALTKSFVAGARFERGHKVVDVVYDPPATPVMEAARAAGADSWGGLGMLIHQAAASFRIWTGRDPSVAAMSAAAVRALRRR
jgi:shikimate dehydrogenase